MNKKVFFSELFDKHYNRLFNYSFKVTKDEFESNELVQETFIQLWGNIDKVNQSERAIESFLITVLKNKIIDHYRKTKVRKKHSEQFLQNVNQLEEIEISWEVLQQIANIYTHLDTKTEEIFKLSREEGMSYTEIADKKSISIKTVESHISKALRAFRKGLKDFL